MNVFISAQSRFVKVADQLLGHVPEIDKVVSFVSDSVVFNKLQSSLVHLNKSGNLIVKEWEVFDSELNYYDVERVKRFELNELKGSLFKAVVTDRRHIFGKNCKSSQDYKSRFDTETLEIRLMLIASRLLQCFEDTKFDYCLTFGISNIQDYVLYKICQTRQLEFRQVRSAKIENFVAVFNEIEAQQNNFPLINEPASSSVSDAAANYINDLVKSSSLVYEGTLEKDMKANVRLKVSNLSKGLLNDLRKIFNTAYRKDNQVEYLLSYHLRNIWLNPWRASIQRKILFESSVQKPSKDNRFFLYPLHFEPEVAIQFYGSSYLNQIELIRNISHSLPIGSRLIVREHPRSMGFRSFKYYRKLKEIPRVILVDGSQSMSSLIGVCDGVFTISGSTGLEAIIRGKPCWVFGRPWYLALGRRMVRWIDSLSTLDEEIVDHLKNFQFDRNIVEFGVQSILDKSLRINLYTDVLGKKGRISLDKKTDDMQKLASLIFSV